MLQFVYDKTYIKKLIILFLFFLLNPKKTFSVVRDIVESVKIINVKSLKQEIVGFNKVILTGNVDVWVDKKMHLWADYVEIDKEDQFLIAKKEANGAVVIENEDFLILADEFYLNLDDKTGYANNFRIQFSEGYVRAGKAQKIGENNWKLDDILFTPCDKADPDWSIVASKARFQSNYLIRLTGLLFKAGPLPILPLPYFIIPIQSRSKSGFLLPKFSYDDDLGFGIREEYYWAIARRCESTFAVDWREKKGIAFSDDFRWVRKPESFSLANGMFAIEKNAFVRKKDRIAMQTDQRYWIQGKDFRSFKKLFSGEAVNSLLQVDFGTDKRIGYQFFDSMRNLEDEFYNSWILRVNRKKDLINLFFDVTDTTRRKFLDLTSLQQAEIAEEYSITNGGEISSMQIEIEDKSLVCRLPHLEWNTIYKNVKNLFVYRHDCFVDRIYSRDRRTEIFYVNSNVFQQHDLLNLTKGDTFRFYYQADLQRVVRFKNQNLKLYVDPNFQIRSNLKSLSQKATKNAIEVRIAGSGAARLFFKCGAEWNLPEMLFEHENDKNNYFYFQPTFKWDFLPKFYQGDWYHSDKYDIEYPKNQLAVGVRSNWYIDNMFINLNLFQGYEFYNQSDIFYLRKPVYDNHLLPLNLELDFGCDVLNFFVLQQYNWRNLKLIQSEIGTYFNINKFNLSLSLIYQDAKLQIRRSLFSDVPHFLLFGVSVPLLKNATLSYDGQFYSEKENMFFPLEGLRLLWHRLSLDYQSHCWGIGMGYEEKRYREYGNWKSDKAFTLYIKLDSLGSFKRKFRRPTTYLNLN